MMADVPLMLLIAEDSRSNAKLILRSLLDHRIAHAVRLAKDGEVALDYLFRNGEYSKTRLSPRPDLIFLDLGVPKVDGWEVLRRIKSDQALSEIPLIVLSTSDADEEVRRAYSLGTNSYLVKPADVDRFATMIRDAGFYWLTYNVTPGRRSIFSVPETFEHCDSSFSADSAHATVPGKRASDDLASSN